MDFEYFFYCVKNYMRLFLDIVIWELVVNDYQWYMGRNFVLVKLLEQLIRIILSLLFYLVFIFVNFFCGNYYRIIVGQDCFDFEDEGGKIIVEYYKFMVLSW